MNKWVDINQDASIENRKLKSKVTALNIEKFRLHPEYAAQDGTIRSARANHKLLFKGVEKARGHASICTGAESLLGLLPAVDSCFVPYQCSRELHSSGTLLWTPSVCSLTPLSEGLLYSPQS